MHSPAPSSPPTPDGDPQQFLLFTVAGGRFGVPVEAVRRIVRAVAVAPLPDAPALVAGLVNVAGDVVPVLDLAPALGRPRAEIDPGEHFVLVRAGRRDVALRVARADGVELIARERMAEPEAWGARYVAAVAGMPDGVVVIHDLDAFLTAAEEERLDRAIAARAAG